MRPFSFWSRLLATLLIYGQVVSITSCSGRVDSVGMKDLESQRYVDAYKFSLGGGVDFLGKAEPLVREKLSRLSEDKRGEVLERVVSLGVCSSEVFERYNAEEWGFELEKVLLEYRIRGLDFPLSRDPFNEVFRDMFEKSRDLERVFGFVDFFE